MKKILNLIAAFGVMFCLSSCSDDEDPIIGGSNEDVLGTENVNSNITTNTTWTNNNIYILQSRIIVEPGATLTIEAGTIIKGESGDGANATALIIAKGAKIMAEGTSSAPIIFTTDIDQIEIGDIDSPNLDETNSGEWGGVIILGNAPISDESNSGTEQIEGIPGDVALAEYGGNDPDDNSGILRYVSIRHGGTRLGDGDEINGLTLGGVGRGTTLDHIEVVGNLDDGIEWFGGTVNASNLVVWAADDDALDIDQGYSGTINNAVVIAFSGTDHGLEIDGPEGSAAGSFTITNVSVKGADDEIANLRDGATGAINGAYFFNFVSPATDTNGAEEGGTGEGDFTFSDDNTFAAYTAGNLSFSNIEITLAENTVIADVFSDFTEADQNAVTNVASGSNSQGANVAVFGWTFASMRGALADF
ncbi:hypothetical protein [Fulvivirga lutimaris]|uniref:hypothetical protein n=1 Tax=Fulvivirga lutimaris TaxID=1819566 RepID=UPI0012BB7A82|nr:hypothetical protein [Fulvivirga lutimaris]MTI38522.1 hypothetical protein [Fulvivirga lutimaris]